MPSSAKCYKKSQKIDPQVTSRSYSCCKVGDEPDAGRRVRGWVSVAVTGVVLGVLALLFGLVPVLGAIVAVPCSAVGITLSAVSLHRARRDDGPVGAAIAGLVTCIVALVVVAIWIVVFAILAGTGRLEQTP